VRAGRVWYGLERQQDLEGASAADRALDLDRAAVGLHDGLDDREAQAGAAPVAAAAVVEPGEALEDRRQPIGRHAAARVDHGDRDLVAPPLAGEPDLISRTGVLDRVLDQRIQREPQSIEIPDHRRRLGRLQPPAPINRSPALQRVRQELVNVDRRPGQEVRILAGGEQQQPVGEAAQPEQLVHDDPGVLGQLGIAAAPPDQLGVTERHRDRRAQLVGGVLDELALALEQAEVGVRHQTMARNMAPINGTSVSSSTSSAWRSTS
jgi:hypothetical protein